MPRCFRLPLVIILSLTCAAASAQTLRPEKVAALKAATVFIVVTFQGEKASGSGFVVKTIGDDTYVVTDHHVANPASHPLLKLMLEETSEKPAIKAVFDSGTLQERSLDAEVVAEDADRDLAVLKVHKLKNPPAPIVLNSAPSVVELTPLMILGFPLGKATAVGEQNPSCTITTSSVSNVRVDLANGRVQDIQVNGGMTHGNSGGPVISSADGKLVGVAVSGFRGTMIAYAIPGEDVRRLLAGSAGAIRIHPRNADLMGEADPKKEGPAELRITLLDPLKTVKRATAYYGKAVPAAKPPVDPPVRMPNAIKAAMTIANGVAVGEVSSPPFGALAVQVELETTNGVVVTTPRVVRITAAALPDPPNFFTPLPQEMADDLRRPGPQDETYPLPQDEAKAKKLRAEMEAWFAKQLVDPFIKAHAANAMTKGDKVGLAALKMYALNRSRLRQVQHMHPSTEYCGHRFDAAVKAGCTDPSVNLYHTFLFRKFTDPKDAVAAYTKLCEALEKAGVPPYQQSLADINLVQWKRLQAKTNRRFVDETKRDYARGLTTLVRLAQDPSPFAVDDALNRVKWIHNDYEAMGWGRDTAWKMIEAAFEKAGVAAWIRDSARGDFLREFAWDAWDARGRNPSDTISKEKMDLFRKRLTDAQSAYEAAWRAAPDQRPAPIGMIAVCKGLGLKRAVMEEWFRRAMTVDPDNYQACRSKLIYLLPRWHGTEEEALGFGRQCLRTRNYRAGLPYVLVDCYKEFEDFSHDVRLNAIAWADMREYYERRLQTPCIAEVYCEFLPLCAARKEWVAAMKLVTILSNKSPVPDFPNGAFGAKSQLDELVKIVEKQAQNAPIGVLVVQVDDKKLESRHPNGELQVLNKSGRPVYTLKLVEQSKELTPGSYRLRIINAPGMAVDREEFSVAAGGNVSVRVQMRGTSKTPAPEPKGLAGDAFRLKWKIEAKVAPESLAFSNDGKEIYRTAYSPPHRVFVHDAKDGTSLPPLKPLQLQAHITSLRVGPNDVLALTMSKQKVAIQDQQEQNVRASHGVEKSLEAVAMVPRRDAYLAQDSPDAIVLHALADGKTLETIRLPRANSIRFLDSSPDGKIIVAVSTAGELYLKSSAAPLFQSIVKPAVPAIRKAKLSPDQSHVALAVGRNVLVLETATGKEKWKLTGLAGEMIELAFSPDGRYLLTISKDGTFLIWDLGSGQQLHRRDLANQVKAMALSSDGKIIAIATEKDQLSCYELKLLHDAGRK